MRSCNMFTRKNSSSRGRTCRMLTLSCTYIAPFDAKKTIVNRTTKTTDFIGVKVWDIN